MDVRKVFRRGNRLIARAARSDPHEPVAFMCECASEGCFEGVTMTPREFETLAAAQGRFVVLEGHEELEGEDVVGDGPGYRVVEDLPDPYEETCEANAG